MEFSQFYNPEVQKYFNHIRIIFSNRLIFYLMRERLPYLNFTFYDWSILKWFNIIMNMIFV